MRKPMFFESLESLRGLAALSIVFLHLPLWYAPMTLNFFRNGASMVQFFFVLSGFVMMHSYGHRLGNLREVGRFMVLRFGRLYPVHLVFLLAFLGVELVKYWAAAHYGMHSPNTVPVNKSTVGVFMQHLFLLQSFGSDNTMDSFNRVSWSISAEFYTYIVFSLAILAFTRMRFLWFSALIAAVTLAIWSYHADDPMPFKRMLSCLCGFFTGCLTYTAYQRYPKPTSYAAGISLLAMVLFFSLKPQNTIMDIGIYPLSAALILCVARAPDSLTARALEWRPLRWLGKVSYALYMCHALVIWSANQFLRMVLHAPERTFTNGTVPQITPLQALWFYPATLAAILVLAALTYHWIETPGRRWSRKQVGVD